MMVLLGLDPSLIVFGGEVRGYGLGVVSLLILIGVAWRTLQRPSGWHWVGLIVSGVFAVQSSYPNCFLLLATFVACGLVAMRRGEWRIWLGFATIGMLTAASMLPYAWSVFPRIYPVMDGLYDPVSWTEPINMFLKTYKWGGALRGVLGVVIGLISVAGLVRQLTLWARRDAGQLEAERELALFLPAFFWIGAVGFWGYMYFLGMGTTKWHHLPWLTLLAVTMQLGLKLWPRDWNLVRIELGFGEGTPQSQQVWQPRNGLLNAGLAALAGVLLACLVAPTVRYRLTSVDLIARELSASVGPNDLIVASPWYLGCTFGRYYRGTVPWINLPDVDARNHQVAYKGLRTRMRLPLPLAIRDELMKIETVLRSGGKVWWIGPLPQLRPGESPLLLTSAPHPQYRWSEIAYEKSWQQVTIARMQSLGVTVDERTPQRPYKIHGDEDPPVFVIEAVSPRPSATR